MLDVVDGEAERLVSLEEAVEDLGADRADPSARSTCRELEWRSCSARAGVKSRIISPSVSDPLSQIARVSRSRCPAMRRKRVRASSAVSISSR